MGASDFAAAERLLERAEAELSRVPARRFATALETARARLAALKGDAREALSRINAAKAHCPTRLPVHLFLAGGPELRPFLAALAIHAAAELEPATTAARHGGLAVPRTDWHTAREQARVLVVGSGNTP